MNKRNKIILSSAGVILAVTLAFVVHNSLLKNAKDGLIQAQTTMATEQSKLSKMKGELTSYEHSKQNNLSGNFPNANFQKKEDAIVPIQANYKPNNAEIAKWVATYMTELRKLNHIDNKVSWQANSTEQAFLHTYVTTGKFGVKGKYTISALGYANTTANPKAGQSESDQETAYSIVMGLYDQSSIGNFAPNQAGNYYPRAYLLYTGNNIGLETNDYGAAVCFDYKDSPEYQKMIKATTAPNTVPLPDVTFDYVDPALDKEAHDKVNAEEAKVSKATAAFEKAQEKVKNIENYFF